MSSQADDEGIGMSFSVLDSALSGPLFVPDSMVDIWSDQSRLDAMLKVEWALAMAQTHNGLCPPNVAEAIAAISPLDFDCVALGQETALSGVPTIPFINALRKKLPPEYEPYVHKEATTQDVMDTALMLQVKRSMEALLPQSVAVLSALSEMASRHAQTPCVGRSYGQHAVPVSFGYKVSIWLAGLCDALAPWPALAPTILKASLAGPVGTLSGRSPAHAKTAQEFAHLLDLAFDPVPWHVRRSPVVSLAAFVTQVLGALAKMAGDVVNLSSTEVGEVSEPFIAGRGGSSAMPHKRNPVASTVILAAFQAAQGLNQTMQAAMVASHERPAGAWHAEWNTLPQLLGLLAGALHEAKRIAEGLEIDTLRMASNLDLTHGLIYADAVASALSVELGASRAHAVIEHAADAVRRTGQHLSQVVSAWPDLPSGFNRDRLQALFDPTPAVLAASLIVPAAREQAERVVSALSAKG